MSTCSGGSFERGRTRVNEPVSKMICCDPRLALCVGLCYILSTTNPRIRLGEPTYGFVHDFRTWY